MGVAAKSLQRLISGDLTSLLFIPAARREAKVEAARLLGKLCTGSRASQNGDEQSDGCHSKNCGSRRVDESRRSDEDDGHLLNLSTRLVLSNMTIELSEEPKKSTEK